VRRGFAVEKSTEELLAILDQARELKLTHITDNVRHKPSFICNCCSCCCELMAGVQSGFTEGIGKTPFLAAVDVEKCNVCGLCYTACNVAAITAPGDPDSACAVVDTQAYLGCGACVPACTRGAISLVERDMRPLPPAKRKDMFVQILKEKGRLTPFLVSGAKKRVGRLLAKRKR